MIAESDDEKFECENWTSSFKVSLNSKYHNVKCIKIGENINKSKLFKYKFLIDNLVLK